MSGRSAPSPMQDLLRPHRRLFVGVGAFSMVINILMLAPALYMLQVYDRVLASRNTTTLLMLTLIVLGLFLLEALLDWIRGQAMLRGSAALDATAGPQVFDAMFERTLAGQGAGASQALADLNTLRHFLTGKGLFAFFDAPWTPLYLLVIFLLHPLLGWFALAAAAVLISLTCLNEKLTAPALADAGREAHSAQMQAANSLRNAEAIGAMGMLHAMRQAWLGRHRRMLALQAAAGERAGAVTSATRLARQIFQSGVLGVGALLVIDNQITPGSMIAASLLLGRSLSPIDAVIGHWRSWVGARDAYHRLDRLLPATSPARQRTALQADTRPYSRA
jgi:ATP-binding cassette, subfamily C, bacterial exporter for protease/lipase